MLSFLNQYAKNHFASQNGEEGILIEVLNRLEGAFQIQAHGHAVEIGGHNGLYCSNTALLLRQRGWSGLFVEADYNLYLQCKDNWKHNPRVRSQCSRVDGKNINAFVDDSCDLLSLDTDGSDYQIFHGLLSKPKIVIVEIDSSIPPDTLGFNADGAAGYLEMVKLAQLRGYFVLCHTGNLVLVDEKYKALFPEIDRDPILESEHYFNRSWLKEEAA